MNWKIVLMVVGIVSLVLANTSGIASASSIDVSVNNAESKTKNTASNPIEMCAGPITPQKAEIWFTNKGPNADTYSIKASGPSGWDVEIQDEMFLDSGSAKMTDYFLVNPPFPWEVSPGDYEVLIEAQSLSVPGDSDKTTLYVKILPCFLVELSTDDDKKDMCMEGSSEVTYNIKVKNSGKWEEKYSLSSSVSWASLSKNTLELGDGDEETVILTAKPPAGTTGTQTMEVLVNSQTSYAKDSIELELEIGDCYDAEMNFVSKDGSVCFGESLTYEIEIKNLGKQDTYTISTPSWIKPDKEKVTVQQNGLGKFKLTLTPEEKGKVSFVVTVQSENDADLKESFTGEIDSEECRGVAIILSPSEKTVCAGEKIEYAVTVKNIGSIEDTFTITSNMGELEEATMTLGPDKTKTISLEIDTLDMVGKKEVKVTASTNGIKDESTSELIPENCYSAGLTITPVSMDSCPCLDMEYMVKLENTGKFTDEYAITYGNKTKKIKLEPGEKESFTLDFPVSCDMEGSYNIMAKVESENIDTKEVQSTLNIKNFDECFNVELENGESALAEIYKGDVHPVIVRNTGENKQSYTITVTGPEWLYITPNQVDDLEAGEEETVYLYVTPPFGTEGDYTATIIAKSDLSDSRFDINIKVTTNATGQEEIIIEEPEEPEEPVIGEKNETNITIGEEGSITLNLSFDEGDEPIQDGNGGIDFTGQFTAIPIWKTVAIGVITIIIIIILVIRFAILVKK
jgi:uncharacterized membrane protein